jgi:hypothetical protein
MSRIRWIVSRGNGDVLRDRDSAPPELAETGAMPAQTSLGLDDRPPPRRQPPRTEEQLQPIDKMEGGTLAAAPQDVDLVAKHGVLKYQLASGPRPRRRLRSRPPACVAPTGTTTAPCETGPRSGRERRSANVSATWSTNGVAGRASEEPPLPLRPARMRRVASTRQSFERALNRRARRCRVATERSRPPASAAGGSRDGARSPCSARMP